MRFEKSFIPYGAYWSTPFCKWQGSFATKNALSFAGEVARDALAARSIAPRDLDGLVVGTTVPQKHGLYAAPWLGALIGAEGATGPTISQAPALTRLRPGPVERETRKTGSSTASVTIRGRRTRC